MENILIKKATIDELDLIVNYIRLMLEEVHSYGGSKPSEDIVKWNNFKERINKNLENPEYCFLIVIDEILNKDIGYGEARLEPVSYIFEDIKTLHISCLYVSQDYRNKGIAKLLMQKLLDFGKINDCLEVDLNVSINNPAYNLYKSLDFKDFTVKMKKNI